MTFFGKSFLRFRIDRAKRKILRNTRPLRLGREEWHRSLTDPTRFYEDSFRFFHGGLPEDIRAHRAYFRQGRRGLSEGAFHAMWHLLFQEFQPGHFLEIGVYRGQMLSLMSLLQMRAPDRGVVAGISPFSNTGDSVSSYRADLNYHEDTLANFAYFNLPC